MVSAPFGQAKSWCVFLLRIGKQQLSRGLRQWQLAPRWASSVGPAHLRCFRAGESTFRVDLPVHFQRKLDLPGNPQRDVELVAAARKSLGDRAELLIDSGWYVHRTAKEAIQMVRRLEPFRPFLIEEPLSPEDYDGYAEVADAVDTLIACGEQEATQWGFHTLITRGKVDVIQPDLSRCGGFTAGRKIAHLAELYNRRCIPHAWTSDLLTAASLHFNAFMRRSVFQEFNVTVGPLSRELCINPIRLKDGMLPVPQGPGLGVEINESVIDKYRGE